MSPIACICLLLVLVPSVLTNFSGLYGTYIVDASNLQTCRTATECSSFCCIANVTLTSNNDNDKASVDVYFDAQTLSRCGASPGGHYIPTSGPVGIASETSTFLTTTVAQIMNTIPLQLILGKSVPHNSVIQQGTGASPCIQQSFIPTASPSSTTTSYAFREDPCVFLLLFVCIMGIMRWIC